LKLRDQYSTEIDNLSDQIDTDKGILKDLELENKKLHDLVDLLKERLHES
jgi:hypothetical protein